jgi:hypothetical protein
VDLSSVSKNALRMCGACRSVHSTLAFVHAAFRGHTHLPHRRNIVNTAGCDIDDADHANGEIRFYLTLDAFE